jgi:hypothetical protein
MAEDKPQQPQQEPKPQQPPAASPPPFRPDHDLIGYERRGGERGGNDVERR